MYKGKISEYLQLDFIALCCIFASPLCAHNNSNELHPPIYIYIYPPKCSHLPCGHNKPFCSNSFSVEKKALHFYACIIHNNSFCCTITPYSQPCKIFTKGCKYRGSLLRAAQEWHKRECGKFSSTGSKAWGWHYGKQSLCMCV